jgi:hypothetical protein
MRMVMTECNAIKAGVKRNMAIETSATHGFNDKNNTSYIPSSAGSFVAEKLIPTIIQLL